MANIGNLSHDDQVSYWIGRVSRMDTAIEMVLHLIYARLLGDGAAWAVVPRMVGPKLEGIKKLLKASKMNESLRDQMLSACRHIKLAHDQRNNAIHKNWIVEFLGSPDEYIASSAPGGPMDPTAELKWDVAQFEAVHEQLAYARVVCLAFWWLSTPEGPEDYSEDTRIGLIEQLNGRFRLTGEGQISYTDEGATLRMLELMNVNSYGANSMDES
jgi:hypothetical protein